MLLLFPRTLWRGAARQRRQLNAAGFFCVWWRSASSNGSRSVSSMAGLSETTVFLTDVEGNGDYLDNFLKLSRGLRRDATGQLELNDGFRLVFGGDGGDKGTYTIRCYEQLVRLKKKYPERVVLLVGNRDVNKIRFTSELDDAQMPFDAMAPEIFHGPIWVPENKRVTLKQYLATELAKRDYSNATYEQIQQIQQDEALLETLNTKVMRLKWMLDQTMGSPGDFERRRHELELIQCPRTTATSSSSDNAETKPITDEQVVQSYLSSVQPNGVIREYLLLGQLAHIHGETLYVHGGVINSDGESVVGYIPPTSSTSQDSRRVDHSIQDWANQLNSWYQQQLEQWIAHPHWSSTKDSWFRGGEELLKYALPDYKQCIMMARHLQPSGMPREVPGHLVSLLLANAIRRVVIGHTPHGNCPTVVKQSIPNGFAVATCSDNHPAQSKTAERICVEQIRSRFEVIMCDTSYSDMSCPDNRGQAVSEVLIDPEEERVIVHGILQDGEAIEYDTSDPLIGKTLSNGFQVKALLTDKEKNQYLTYKVEKGFEYSYEYRTRDDIERDGQ